MLETFIGSNSTLKSLLQKQQTKAKNSSSELDFYGALVGLTTEQTESFLSQAEQAGLTKETISELAYEFGFLDDDQLEILAENLPLLS